MHHKSARIQLERLVADGRAVNAHAAAVNQAIGFAGRWCKARLLEQGANAERRAGQGDFGDLVGNAALGTVLEVSLGRIGRRRAVEARCDLARQQL